MLLNALHIARIWRQRCLMFVLVMSEPLRQFSICHAEPPVQGNATQTSTGQCARAHSSNKRRTYCCPSGRVKSSFSVMRNTRQSGNCVSATEPRVESGEQHNSMRTRVNVHGCVRANRGANVGGSPRRCTGGHGGPGEDDGECTTDATGERPRERDLDRAGTSFPPR